MSTNSVLLVILMQTKYVIKGIWDDEIVYYVDIDKNNSFFGIPIIRLSTSIDEAMHFNTVEEVEEAYAEVSHVTFKIYPVCPICGRAYSGYPALSRKDNKTNICPDCGMLEALIEFDKHRH